MAACQVHCRLLPAQRGQMLRMTPFRTLNRQSPRSEEESARVQSRRPKSSCVIGGLSSICVGQRVNSSATCHPEHLTTLRWQQPAMNLTRKQGSSRGHEGSRSRHGTLGQSGHGWNQDPSFVGMTEHNVFNTNNLQRIHSLKFIGRRSASDPKDLRSIWTRANYLRATHCSVVDPSVA